MNLHIRDQVGLDNNDPGAHTTEISGLDNNNLMARQQGFKRLGQK